VIRDPDVVCDAPGRCLPVVNRRRNNSRPFILVSRGRKRMSETFCAQAPIAGPILPARLRDPCFSLLKPQPPAWVTKNQRLSPRVLTRGAWFQPCGCRHETLFTFLWNGPFVVG